MARLALEAAGAEVEMISDEFEDRTGDGLDDLVRHLELPETPPVEPMDEDRVAGAVIAGNQCRFAVLFRTAPQLESTKLKSNELT